MPLPDRDTIIEQAFPTIANNGGYTITSPETPSYNCIAWAAHADHHWWEPDPSFQYFWPKSVRRAYTIDSYVAAYSTIGYVVCADGELEEGFEKIAIFTDASNVPKHAARQLDGTLWTSKLGRHFDISHALHGVSGAAYGTPSVFMKRLRAQT